MRDGTLVELAEQAEREVDLSQTDAEYLAALKFVVIPCAAQDKEGQHLFTVNPQQWVGHFRLPSGAVVKIIPKIPSASVLRMLAYAFLRWNDQMMRHEAVEYATDSFLFEPLVRLFNDLVAARTRRGLVQDYVRHEENLSLVRGKILFREHIQTNVGYPNRVYCRFFENTVDIPDNQIIRRTLRLLLANGGWTRGTEHGLIANFHQFEAVSDGHSRSIHFGAHHYHHLNEDYEPIHRLCALFIAIASISEAVGDLPFKGFLLDLNKLFEKFVEQAFVTVAKKMDVEIRPQKAERLSDAQFAPMIQPDIAVAYNGRTAAIIDAKYKRDAYGPQNSDIYQVLAYGTALRCDETYLFYPETELALDRTIPIRNSPIVVNTRRVAISGDDCVRSAEESVRTVLNAVVNYSSAASFKMSQ
jgi:5-methylcytosine-specific restriction enzyme subunit McrC